MNTEYEEYLERARREHGAKFDASNLASQFIPYFHSGERITVEFRNSEGKVYEVRRGTVGVTTGWRPCFLLMATRRSIGSSYTLSAKDQITTMDVWREFKKQEVA